MPLGEMHGIGPGNRVVATERPFQLPVGEQLLGRVIDGLGTPIDGGPPLEPDGLRSTAAPPPDPLGRARIDERLSLGVRALDALVPCGRGQRLGIFAGSGVGKSSLLGMIARSTHADVNVICLVGERGREVREFVERDLGDRRRALGRRRRHLGRAGARPHQGRVRRDDDRRGVPRHGRRRPADDGLDHPLRDGAARGRPRDRRAADDARLHAVGVRAAAAPARARRARASAARSPASTPCSSRATT